jgi:hypothetical protein
MNPFDTLFGPDTKKAREKNPYSALGLSRNPFMELPDTPVHLRPFYTGHIESKIETIRKWLKDVSSDQVRTPLSISGSIGTGKSRIVGTIEHFIRGIPTTQKLVVATVKIPEGGYSKATIGGLLIGALERTSIPGSAEPPNPEILPLVWAIANSKSAASLGDTPLAKALNLAKTAKKLDKELFAQLISRWLRRSPLTNAQMQEIGLARQIDWEGALIGEVAELARVARKVGVIKIFFLLFDQLEDVLRPTFSKVRQSRMLTDLRALVDEVIDGQAPFGLLFSRTPETQLDLRKYYPALESRLSAVIDLPWIEPQHREPFAQVWIHDCEGEEGFDVKKQKGLVGMLVARAISRLDQEGKLIANRVTLREFRGALADEVESLVHEKSLKKGK